jgi:hypothetical protein
MRATQARNVSIPKRSTTRVSAAAPVRTPTTSALMSPATIFGTRELAVAMRKMSDTRRPRENSFTPGNSVPSWKTSTVSVEYGSLPPMSSQCALIAA